MNSRMSLKRTQLEELQDTEKRDWRWEIRIEVENIWIWEEEGRRKYSRDGQLNRWNCVTDFYSSYWLGEDWFESF